MSASVPRHDCLLGIDIGTYSSKGALTTSDGEIIASHTIEHNLSVPQPGWAEHDPEQTWWGEFVAICRALREKSHTNPRDVAAVAVSAIGPCVLPVDATGRALRSGILYGMDVRSTSQIAALNARYDPAEMYEVCGSYLTTQAGGPKIMWLREHEPDVYESAQYFHSASDYIVLRLTDSHVVDAYTAASYTPLFDIRTGAWTEQFADAIVDIRRLPEVKWAGEIAGEVTAGAAEATGLAEGTPVTVGTVDAVAEAVSVGAIQPGDLMCMYGTTAFFILATDRVARHPSMWSVYHAFPGLYGMAAGMSTTGALTRWFRDQFARELPASDAYRILAAEAAFVPLGSLGLVALPYFSGERTPINDPEARGLICGLTLAHTRAHVYRAILEGTAYGIAHNFDAMRAAGGTPRRIVAVGGGTYNPLWLQIVSDVSGLPQEVPAQRVGASYGDAFLAGHAVGLIPSPSELGPNWVRIERTTEPNPERHDRYAEFYAIYQRLYEETKSEQHMLATLARREPAQYQE